MAVPDKTLPAMKPLSVRDRHSLKTAMHRSAGHAFRLIVGSLWAWPLNEQALRQSTGPEGRPLASLPRSRMPGPTSVYSPAHQWTSTVSSYAAGILAAASRARLSLLSTLHAIV